MTRMTRSTEQLPPLTDWSKVSLLPEMTTPTRASEPTRAVPAVDARILADDEVDELRRLRDQCVEWLSLTRNPLRPTDKKLAHAIRRVRRFAR